MGNAQSNDAGANPNVLRKSQPSSPATAQEGRDGKEERGQRRIPIRKDSIAAVPSKASPTVQDNGLLIHADNTASRGTGTALTAAEKLLDITNASAMSTSHAEPSSLRALEEEEEEEASLITVPGLSGEKEVVAQSATGNSVPIPTSDKTALKRPTSFASETTVDTVDDADELNIDDSRAIPTTISWPHEARKAYVTGTFSGWKKKFRLTQNNGIFSIVINLPPGTHHLLFLIDGEMRMSDAIPSAVDATGILVNYIEVSADDMPPLTRQFSRQFSRASLHHEHVAGGPTDSAGNSFDFGPAAPAKEYTSVIPSFLEELEERQERYGTDFSGMLPPPPSLPMILSKVILNGNTSIKDDSSVLGIPNHVVLNHLATSSIKNHVLAISATTRYKKKYVSTILYTSTSNSEDE